MQDSKKSVLIEELTDFNAGLLQGMDKHTTRGIRNLLSWCAIGGADLIAGKEGAQIGGAIGCIGGAVDLLFAGQYVRLEHLIWHILLVMGLALQMMVG